MKFGIREVTDIVFKAKVNGQQVGQTGYSAGVPVMVVDSAKMSSLENAVTTVYAQGGKGNPRLLAWDGDRTATFKFEESIITTDGLAIISGSGIASGTTQMLRQQIVFTASGTTFGATPTLPSSATIAYLAGGASGGATVAGATFNLITLDATGDITGVTTFTPTNGTTTTFTVPAVVSGTKYIVDFYVVVPGKQLQVEAGRFAGYYYVEANTLFRDLNGSDHPAQITIPKAKVKSNFTLTMSPTGDPTTFAFEIDALPDYTNFVTDKKVLYTLDIADSTASDFL
jgi:hypothetical protein